MTAAEKRAYLVNYSKQFSVRPTKGSTPLMEVGGENKGDFLEEVLKIVPSWRSPKPWCAAFVSAMSLNVDKLNPDGPKTQYNSVKSSEQGAGIYSNDPRNAKPGLAIIWTQADGSGHAGIVLSIDSNGITTIEGNSGSVADPQKREGYAVCIKKYTFSQFQNPNPSKGRKFIGFAKIWEENDESLGSKLPELPSNTNYENSSGSSITQTESQKARIDISSLFINITADDSVIKEVRKETKLDENITAKNDKEKSKSKISIDKTKV